MKDKSGNLQYEAGPSNPVGLLENLGFNNGVTSTFNGFDWVITDNTAKPAKTASLALGTTGRNPFYCSGKGVCGTPDFTQCSCDPDYEPGDGTCKPKATCSRCADSINVEDNATGKMRDWPLSDCTDGKCVCLGPDGKQGSSWPNSDVRFGGGKGGIGPMKQFGIDTGINAGSSTMYECGLCAPDDDKNCFGSGWSMDGPPTCTNETNWGCCSGQCYTTDSSDGGTCVACGCFCDAHCPDDQFCQGSSCVDKSTVSKGCRKGGTATFF